MLRFAGAQYTLYLKLIHCELYLTDKIFSDQQSQFDINPPVQNGVPLAIAPYPEDLAPQVRI